jgi:hypothetical protein
MIRRRRTTPAKTQRAYRKRTPEYQITEAMRVKARYRAMSALARRHPAEYVQLYNIELEKLVKGK